MRPNSSVIIFSSRFNVVIESTDTGLGCEARVPSANTCIVGTWLFDATRGLLLAESRQAFISYRSGGHIIIIVL